MNIRKISKYWMPLLGILFCCITECRAENILDFKANTIKISGIEMPYRSAHVSGTGKTSLVIYLHGGSSKGSDNETQMKEAGIDSIANYLEAKQIEATFLVPQCPSDKSWGGPMLSVLKALIDKYVGEGLVDRSRIYIFGGSMGGTGTWSMLSAYQGLFAAAMPVAGNPSKCDADKVALTPIYTVMGTADQIMSVETASDFVEELKARNGITKFDIEEGWTHEVTCIQSYTTERLDWVFSHTNTATGIESTTTNNKAILSTQYYSIDGRMLAAQPNKGLYIIRQVYEDGTTTSLKKMK